MPFRTTLIRRKEPLIRPYVKWAGGKRRLLPELKAHMPAKLSGLRYYEPFVGAGALFFDLQPDWAVINDNNADLMATYAVIRDNVDELIEILRGHAGKHCKEYYYRVRELDRPAPGGVPLGSAPLGSTPLGSASLGSAPLGCASTGSALMGSITPGAAPTSSAHSGSSPLSAAQKAARLIYLNRTCYNGLYRVNSRGHFNVPYGRYANPLICDESVLRAISMYLNHKNVYVKIICEDFESAVKDAGKGAFIYFDPPYYSPGNAGFTGYQPGGFGEGQQRRLRDVFKERAEAGAKCMLSNSDTLFIRELYSGGEFEIVQVKNRRAINSDAAGRSEVNELLIKSRGY